MPARGAQKLLDECCLLAITPRRKTSGRKRPLSGPCAERQTLACYKIRILSSPQFGFSIGPGNAKERQANGVFGRLEENVLRGSVIRISGTASAAWRIGPATVSN